MTNTIVISKAELHHKAKLSNELVKAMRKEHLAYVRGYETLAKKYQCGISTARDICTYRTRVNVK